MNTIKQALLITALSLSNIAALNLLTAKPAFSAACGALANYAAFSAVGANGCSGTPSAYGIKVYKIGFCNANPLAGGAGTTPDYSSCTLTFQDTTGAEASFAAGENISLPNNRTTPPTPGAYPFAIIEISNSFTIAAELTIGNDTYYSTTTPDANGRGTVADKTANAATAFTFPVKTFAANCVATQQFNNVGGANLTASLLNGTDQIIANSNNANCGAGTSKIVGVAQLGTPFTIKPETKSCLASFTVTNSGATFVPSTNQEQNLGQQNVYILPGPFRVAFTIAE